MEQTVKTKITAAGSNAVEAFTEALFTDENPHRATRKRKRPSLP